MENQEKTVIEEIDSDRVYVFFKGVSHSLLQRLFIGNGIYVKRNYAFPDIIQKHPDYESIVVVPDRDKAEEVVKRYREWVDEKEYKKTSK